MDIFLFWGFVAVTTVVMVVSIVKSSRGEIRAIEIAAVLLIWFFMGYLLMAEIMNTNLNKSVFLLNKDRSLVCVVGGEHFKIGKCYKYIGLEEDKKEIALYAYEEYDGDAGNGSYFEDVILSLNKYSKVAGKKEYEIEYIKEKREQVKEASREEKEKMEEALHTLFGIPKRKANIKEAK